MRRRSLAELRRNAEASIMRRMKTFLMLLAFMLNSSVWASEFSAVSWGGNDSGESSVPSSNGEEPRSATTTISSSCVLNADGSVNCFGCENEFYDVGQCDTKKIPVGWKLPFGGMRTTNEPLESIDSTIGDSCGINDKGGLECWGCKVPRQSSQCAIPKRLNESRQVQVATGEHHTCSLDERGRISCWGCDGKKSQECDPPGNLRAKFVAASMSDVCVVLTNDEVECFGGSEISKSFPHFKVKSISLSKFGNEACAIRSDGRLSCWGESPNPICEKGESVDCLSGAARWKSVAAGNEGTCAIGEDGMVSCGGCPVAREGACAVPKWVRRAVSIAVSDDHAIAIVPTSEVPADWKPPVAARTSLASIVKAWKRLPETRAYSEARGDYENRIGMRFKTIRGGSFVMGSYTKLHPSKIGRYDAAANDNEYPPHEERVGEFQMSEFETTIGEFKRFLKESGYKADSKFYEMNDMPSYYPVAWVSWKDAEAFVKWLNESKPASDGGTYRLPTEAEWEYAARAGSGTVYWFGDEAKRSGLMNCNDCFKTKQLRQPTPEGYFKPNAFGLYDMLGNIDEYVSSCYTKDYSTKACFDGYVAAKGGSWDYPAENARIAWRDYYQKNSRTMEDGFRVARDAPKAKAEKDFAK